MCDCNGDERDVIVMEDENGQEVEFEVVGAIEFEGEDYVIVVDPEAEDEEDATTVIVMKQIGEEEFETVEDEELCEKILEALADEECDCEE